MCYRCDFCGAVVPHRTPRRVHVTYRRTGPLRGTVLRERPACAECAWAEAARPLPPPPAVPAASGAKSVVAPHNAFEPRPPVKRGLVAAATPYGLETVLRGAGTPRTPCRDARRQQTTNAPSNAPNNRKPANRGRR